MAEYEKSDYISPQITALLVGFLHASMPYNARFKANVIDQQHKFFFLT